MEKFCKISFCQLAGKNKRRNQDALFNGESVFQYVFKKPETRIETRAQFIIGVADGVHNSTAPAKASKVVMETLQNLKVLNKETVIYLQDKLSESLADNYFGSATTFVAAEINQLERKAKILSVGDSRAYLISQNGEWKQITEDHSILSDIIQLSKDKNPDNYASIYGGVSSYLVADNSEFKEKIFFQEITFQEGDTLLLCTDGLTDSIDSGNRKQIWDRYDNVLERLSSYQKLVKDLMFYDSVSVIMCSI
ncbi:PP2C family protein-serine/threonine phosphatase [Ursidibacter sp. B-7004-1]